MTNAVFEAFLQAQGEAARRLNAQCDTVVLHPADPLTPAASYVAQFRCPCLAKASGAALREIDVVEIGIRFTTQHLRVFDTVRALQVLAPRDLFHPNIIGPVMCVGHLAPGATLEEMVLQVYEVLTYQRVTMNETDALNHEACRWARANQGRFPLSSLPLKRRRVRFDECPA